MTNLDELEALERKAPPVETVEESFLLIHKVATGQSDCSYMSVPADPKRDADLIVGGALEHYAALRNAAVPMIQELRELRNEVEEHKAIKRHVAQRVIEAIGASGPENLNDSVGRLLAERDALRAQLATAREDALEEAALEASEHMAHACRAAGMTSGECVAESIRALKTTKGTT